MHDLRLSYKVYAFLRPTYAEDQPYSAGGPSHAVSAKEDTVGVSRRVGSLGVDSSHCLVLHGGSCLAHYLCACFNDTRWGNIKRAVSPPCLHHTDCIKQNLQTYYIIIID